MNTKMLLQFAGPVNFGPCFISADAMTDSLLRAAFVIIPLLLVSMFSGILLFRSVGQSGAKRDLIMSTMILYGVVVAVLAYFLISSIISGDLSRLLTPQQCTDGGLRLLVLPSVLASSVVVVACILIRKIKLESRGVIVAWAVLLAPFIIAFIVPFIILGANMLSSLHA